LRFRRGSLARECEKRRHSIYHITPQGVKKNWTQPQTSSYIVFIGIEEILDVQPESAMRKGVSAQLGHEGGQK
jgi:hypothetical protein